MGKISQTLDSGTLNKKKLEWVGVSKLFTGTVYISEYCPQLFFRQVLLVYHTMLGRGRHINNSSAEAFSQSCYRWTPICAKAHLSILYEILFSRQHSHAAHWTSHMPFHARELWDRTICPREKHPTTCIGKKSKCMGISALTFNVHLGNISWGVWVLQSEFPFDC